MHSTRYGSGKPLLLVHGLGADGQSWQPVISGLAAQRQVVAVDLPGFGQSPPLTGEVTIASLTDAVEEFIASEGLDGVDTVGSSMGGRMVLELARRGVGGNAVDLDPDGFWTDGELRVFHYTLAPSIKLVLALQPVMPALMGSPVGRTALLSQFSARPWALSKDVALHEVRAFARATSLDAAFAALVHGPKQEGAPDGTTPGRVVIGWGRKDKVTLPRQASRAQALFPDASLHWFERSGHFPQWDEPAQTVEVILEATA